MGLDGDQLLILTMMSVRCRYEEEAYNGRGTLEMVPVSSIEYGTGKHELIPCSLEPLFWIFSKEFEEMARGLRESSSCNPGGGPGVASLMDRFLALWPVFLKELYPWRNNKNNKNKVENEGLLKMKNEVKMVSMALQTVLWEKLHSGIWKEVSVIWRDAYSFSCLLSAVVELEMVPGMEERRKKALRYLDLATLMGGPLWRPIINQFISALVQLFNRKSPSCSANSVVGGTEPPEDLTFAVFQERRNPTPLMQWLPQGGLGTSSLSEPVPRHHLLSLETFATDYMLPQHPVIISGAMHTWPALEKWQRVDYWRRIAGPRTVPVEVGKNYMTEGWGQQLMLFSEFLDNHLLSYHHQEWKSIATPKNMENDSQIRQEIDRKIDGGGGGKGGECVYLAQHDLTTQIPQLAEDIHHPEYCSLGQTVHATNTWIGPAGTVTPLHTDPEQNLLCQVVGAKYVRLYSPEQNEALLGGNNSSGNGCLTMNTSPVDVDTHVLMLDTLVGVIQDSDSDAEEYEKERIGRMKYPLYAAAPFLDCILQPGDMLYIPAGWWHYVRSLNTSASVNFWWRK